MSRTSRSKVSRVREAKPAAVRVSRSRWSGETHVDTVGADENIFEVLGLPDAGEWLAKAELARAIGQLIKQRSMTQTAAATLLEVAQSDISNLSRGRLSGYSMDRLYRFLNALGQDIQIVVRPKPSSRKMATVRAVVRGKRQGVV